jgi:hypothetical protein
MSRTSTLILLGILVILAPFSGLPIAFRTLLEVIFGACVLGIGFTMRSEESRRAHPPVESAPEPEPPPTISPI